MAKTEFGTFGEMYHHIDAPTRESHMRTHYYGQRLLIDLPIVSAHYTDRAFYDLESSDWVATRKLDGTNIRVRWDGERAIIAGKTNEANLSALGRGFKEYMRDHFQEGRFEEKFGREKIVVIFGEWVGPKVQGNELKLETPELVIFDVQINNIWLNKESVNDIAKHFDCHTPMSFMKNEEVISGTLLDLMLAISDGKYEEWEGIVAEPVGQFRDKTGKRIICKIKNRDYLPDAKRARATKAAER